MIHRQRHLIADFVANLRHILLEHIKPLLRHVNARERMRRRHQLIAALVAHHVPRHRAALHVQYVRGVFLHVVQKAQRRGQRARLVHQKADAQIHLEERKAALHALFERPAHVAARVAALDVRIAVDADLIAEFAAQQLIQRHAVRLARQIPERHLDRRDAAALPGGAAELLDLVEDLVHVAGIFAEDAAFEHQRVGL